LGHVSGRIASKSSDGVAFEGSVADAVGGVRRSMAAIVERVCGGSPRAQDVTDRFGVYRKLGWQVWNVAFADDAMSAVRHLPNPRTLKVWREAAQGKGVSETMLRKLDDAIVRFRASADAHAPDREALEMLVSGRADSRRDEATDAKWRRQGFVGNAYTWGVRAKCMVASAIILPSDSRDGYFDLIRMQALFGLMRTRPGVRWPFAQLRIRDSSGNAFSYEREPLAMSATFKRTGVPLLEKFCSRPLPAVERKPGATPGVVEDELLPGDVGQAAAADIVTGEHLRAVAPAWADEPGRTTQFGTGVRTPSELLISDQLVHRDLYPNVTRELRVFGELMTPLSRDERDLLPVAEKIQHLGRGVDGVATADAPRYHEILKFMIARSGHDAEEFDVFRVRMRYPPLPVSIVIRHEEPMRPASQQGSTPTRTRRSRPT
jgi:hypothetical protein